MTRRAMLVVRSTLFLVAVPTVALGVVKEEFIRKVAALNSCHAAAAAQALLIFAVGYRVW